MNHQLETNDHQQVTNLSPTAVKQKERSTENKKQKRFKQKRQNDRSAGTKWKSQQISLIKTGES